MKKRSLHEVFLTEEEVHYFYSIDASLKSIREYALDLMQSGKDSALAGLDDELGALTERYTEVDDFEEEEDEDEY